MIWVLTFFSSFLHALVTQAPARVGKIAAPRREKLSWNHLSNVLIFLSYEANKELRGIEVGVDIARRV